ncbi:MAG: lipopolysaccharide transport periplasmic protein LptA [Ghiorsea sp.]
MKTWLAVCIVCFPCFGFAAAMQVDADQFELVQEEKRAEFVGHVTAVRGEMKITADKMTLWYQEEQATGKNRLKSAKAVGNVQLFTADNQGEADQARFDVDSDVIVLKGNASMENAQGVVRGEHIEYHISSQDTQVLKGDTEQQVRFIFDE